MGQTQQTGTGAQQGRVDRRVALDCREYPGSECSLKITGTEDEVLKEGVRHAVADHGVTDEPRLREELRKQLSEERSGYRA